MFSVAGVRIVPERPWLDTTIGRFATRFDGGDRSTADAPPYECLQLAGRARLYRFDGGAWVAELLAGPVEPALPPGMAVSGCLTVVWRVRALATTSGCRFVCRLVEPTSAGAGSPDTGEGLDALTWRVGQTSLSLGTEDGEFLAKRAEQGDLVPRRLGGELSLSTIEYDGWGLVVPFSGLEPSEVLQVQFVVAWENECAEDSVTSWFAVEQDPGHLLRQLVGDSAVDIDP